MFAAEAIVAAARAAVVNFVIITQLQILVENSFIFRFCLPLNCKKENGNPIL
jgi:hypothetical protein